MARKSDDTGNGVDGIDDLPSGGVKPADDTGNAAGSGDGFAPGTIVIDPGSVGGSGGNLGSGGRDNPGGGGNAKRPRGRPRGSANSTAKVTQGNLDASGIEALLISIHLCLYAVTKTDELMLDKSEAAQLATAAANVARHYNLSATQRTIDWTNLIMVCGMVYGTRAVAIMNNRKPKDKTAESDGGTVFNLHAARNPQHVQ